MPALRLGRAESPRHAVVGARNGDDVRHVGLLAQEMEISEGQRVHVNHMKPPPELPGSMDAHAVAWLDGWSDHDTTVLDVWLWELKTQLMEEPPAARASYIAVPSVVRDEGGTGRPVSLRFSCAGFVAEAYRDGVGVRIVVDDGELPAVERATLERVWGAPHVRIGARYGLEGNGPWRVLLPGYLLRAMCLPRSELPFRPQAPSDADLTALAMTAGSTAG